MARHIDKDEANRILRDKFALHDKPNNRYHSGAADADRIRYNLNNFGPCGDCAHLIREQITVDGKEAVRLRCEQHISALRRQQLHEMTTPFPHGMFECEEFDPK